MTNHEARAASWPLLTACARHAAGLADARSVAEAADGVSDWDEAERRAQAHGLLPWLARSLTQAGAANGPRERVVAAATEAAARTLWQVRQLAQVSAALAAAGVPVLPYKGPALSMQLYGDLALRQSVDLDLVVPRHSYDRARAVLVHLGLPPRAGHSERQERTLFAWLGHVPFGTGDQFVELHWRFADRRFAFPLSPERALARAQPVVVGGHSLALPAHDDLLVLLAFHGARHLYGRLEWLAGVARLLHAAPDDGAHLMAHARSLHARRMLAVSVFMAGRLLGMPITESWRPELASDPYSDVLAARMANELVANELESRPLLHGAALQQRYGDLVDTRRDRARLFAHALLDPTARDQETIALPDAMLPLHYVIRPVRLAATYLGRRFDARGG